MKILISKSWPNGHNYRKRTIQKKINYFDNISKIILCTLGLKHAEIEDDGIQAVLNAFAHANSNVKKLYLWGNNVSNFNVF